MSTVIALEPLRSGLGDFLPLLGLFFIWWVSSRIARKNRPNEEGSSSARSSSQAGPSEVANGVEGVNPFDILRQMLFGGLEMPPMPTRQPAPPGAPLTAESGEPYQGVTDWKAIQAQQPTYAERVVPAASLRQEEVRENPVRKVSPSVEISPKPERTALVLARIPRHELQRAVAWSEVIAPPVSLRDESR